MMTAAYKFPEHQPPRAGWYNVTTAAGNGRVYWDGSAWEANSQPVAWWFDGVQPAEVVA